MKEGLIPNKAAAFLAVQPTENCHELNLVFSIDFVCVVVFVTSPFCFPQFDAICNITWSGCRRNVVNLYALLSTTSSNYSPPPPPLPLRGHLFMVHSP